MKPPASVNSVGTYDAGSRASAPSSTISAGPRRGMRTSPNDDESLHALGLHGAKAPSRLARARPDSYELKLMLSGAAMPSALDARRSQLESASPDGEAPTRVVPERPRGAARAAWPAELVRMSSKPGDVATRPRQAR